MIAHDIAKDTAELLSVLLEAILYGFSLLMFGGTVWMVLQKSTDRMNRKMFLASCALLLFSTIHLVIDIIRVMQGLVLYRDRFEGGPIGYFSDVSHWTFVWKNYVYTAQTLVGDAVVLYRCHVAWQSRLVMIVPVLLWCGVAVTGFVYPLTASRAVEHRIYDWSLWKWITSFYTTTFVTNSSTTILLVLRIWYVDRKAMRLHGCQRSQLRPILHIMIDAGVIYSLTLLAALICFTSRSNGQFVILNMITPIISITFYMAVIRVGLANWANQPENTSPRRCSFSDSNGCTPNRGDSRMQVRVTTMTEYEVESRRCSPTPTTLVTGKNSRDNSVLAASCT